jgi:hypothetical protein
MNRRPQGLFVSSQPTNEAACLRLASAILMEFDDEWQIGRVYLAFHEERAPQS